MTTELEPGWTSVAYDIDSDVVATAVRHAIAATETETVGDYGRAFLVPEGYSLRVEDERTLSDPTVPARSSSSVSPRSPSTSTGTRPSTRSATSAT